MFNNSRRFFTMLYIGIDVASRKHDYCIIDGSGEILHENIVIKNNLEGFESLLSQIRSCPHKSDFSDVKIGLEATGHYNKNITEFLRKHHLNVTVLNLLQVNLLQKADSLRKTRTDKSAAIFIAQMMVSRQQPLKLPVPNEIDELRELVRHRSRLVEMNSKFKVSVSRIISIVFPELPETVWSIHQKSAYAMLLTKMLCGKLKLIKSTLRKLPSMDLRNGTNYANICRKMNFVKP
jgi:transposase